MNFNISKISLLSLTLLLPAWSLKLNLVQLGVSQWTSIGTSGNKESQSTLPSTQVYLSHQGWEYHIGVPVLHSQAKGKSHTTIGDVDIQAGTTIYGSYASRYHKSQLKIKVGSKIPFYEPLPIQNRGDLYIGSGNISPYINTSLVLPQKWISPHLGLSASSQIKWASPLTFTEALRGSQSWDNYSTFKASWDKIRYLKISGETFFTYTNNYWKDLKISETNASLGLASGLTLPITKSLYLAGYGGISIWNYNQQQVLDLTPC